MLQYRFNCGSGEGQARIDEISISDGNWHTIVVERFGQIARILVDGRYAAEGGAPGTSAVLNLESSHIFFGAEVKYGVSYSSYAFNKRLAFILAGI